MEKREDEDGLGAPFPSPSYRRSKKANRRPFKFGAMMPHGVRRTFVSLGSFQGNVGKWGHPRPVVHHASSLSRKRLGPTSLRPPLASFAS